MFDKIARYWRTVQYLKPVQLRYQIYYRFRRFFRIKDKPAARTISPGVTHKLRLKNWIPCKAVYEEGSFVFLNRCKNFEGFIDWNFDAYGKLWTYNLNYFDFLLQPDMDKETGLSLIHHFIEFYTPHSVGSDPYPISLRTINWIKFCLKFEVREPFLDESLYAQLLRLNNNLEYHLMGNHLLENGCALLIGGKYFEEPKFLQQGKQVLWQQLDEQILRDGAHFERSPMYHQILLSRLLDCYNFVDTPLLTDKKFKDFLQEKVELMLGWLACITFKNGVTPKVNDAADGIAPSPKEIINYAHRLGISIPDTTLNESGYRMIKEPGYEWFLDVGDIGPDYIPGHAHSDTFSFVLNVHDKPIIVDTGVSTYEEGMTRQSERSTAAHNTVMINGREQTEVWKAFRVGRRARITKREEGETHILAEHDGYKPIGLTHRRMFKWSEKQLIIKDLVKGRESLPCIAYFHFHPQIDVEEKGQMIIADGIKLSFEGLDELKIKPYQFAAGFNRLKQAKVLEVNFAENLETKIKL